MSRPELKVGYKTDANTNSLSFKDNAKRLTTELGEFVLSPSQVILDKDTGEEISYATIAITEQNYKDRKRKEYLRNKTKNEEYREFGTFLFLVFSRLEELFPNLSNRTISMLIMLSSFLDYDNVLRKGNNQLMYRSDLPKILDTSKSTVSKFTNALQNENILIVNDDGTMRINPERIYRGKVKKPTSRTSFNTTRIYINACRELYYSCDKKNRSKLSYVYRLLPWIDFKHNVLCWNPDEENEEELKLMSLGDYADVIGYGRDHAKSLCRDLFSFKLYGKPVILIVYSGDFKRASVLINPSLAYAGHDVGIMRDFFNAQADKEEEKKKK